MDISMGTTPLRRLPAADPRGWTGGLFSSFLCPFLHVLWGTEEYASSADLGIRRTLEILASPEGIALVEEARRIVTSEKLAPLVSQGYVVSADRAAFGLGPTQLGSGYISPTRQEELMSAIESKASGNFLLSFSTLANAWYNETHRH